MRRKPEEFEPINKGGKGDLGKGSYGSVKLVRDKTNGKEFAMKIVDHELHSLDAQTLDI
jgi:serine/threonine protein kinase